MPTSDQERLDAISKALAEIKHRQDAFDQRLAGIEAALKVAPAEPQHEAPVEKPEPVAQVAAEPKPPRRPWLETSIGLTLINRVGVVTLVLGIGFFFKWAVDNEWIGPAARVALGIIAGFFTIAAGEILARKEQRTFAQGVTATGISILYLATYAAFAFYQLIPQALAVASMPVITALAGVLALRYEALAIAALGLFGGYLTPVLLGARQDHPWFLMSYLLVLAAGALAIARTRLWRLLEVLSAIGTAILYTTWMVRSFNHEKQFVATLFLLAFYALYMIAGRIEPVFLAAQFFTTAGVAIVSASSPGRYFMLAILLAAAGLWVAERRSWRAAVSVAFVSFWAISGLFSSDSASLKPPGILFAGFTFGFLLFLAWTPWALIVRQQAIGVQDLYVLALNAAAYFGACYWRFNSRYHAWLGLFAIALAGVHVLLAYELWQRQPQTHRELRPVLLSFGVALALFTLAIPLQFTDYRITMAWSLEAAAFSWIGARLRSARMIVAAAVVFVLVWARLAFIDAWVSTRTPLLNERFLTFAIAAVCFWLAAKWIEAPAELRLVLYLAGHAAMLWTLTQETLSWAGRVASPGNVVSVETISVSILYALYAVVLVSAGVATRTAVNRIAGLVIMSAVVVKLYVFDVWQLGRFYRTLAFVALGILLLSTSFLYSHFRALIESWWKKDQAGT